MVFSFSYMDKHLGQMDLKKKNVGVKNLYEMSTDGDPNFET